MLLPVLLLTACGADEEEPKAEPEAPLVTNEALTDRCGGVETAEAEPFRVDSPTGDQLYAVAAGAGETAVVLVHGSGTTGVCVWAADLPWLAETGYRVIGYDAACVGNSTCDAEEPAALTDLAAVVAAARDDGAERVVVLAASAGGPLAPQIAAVEGSGVDAAIALSPAELELDVPGSELSTAAAAAAAVVPVLYVLAEDDPHAEVADVRALAESSAQAELVAPREGGHAQELLTTEAGGGTEVRRQVLAFISGS